MRRFRGKVLLVRSPLRLVSLTDGEFMAVIRAIRKELDRNPPDFYGRHTDYAHSLHKAKDKLS